MGKKIPEVGWLQIHVLSPSPLSLPLWLSILEQNGIQNSQYLYKFALSQRGSNKRNLKLEYIDLYLIHWPVSSKPGTFEYPIKKEDLLPMDYKSVWAAMEECQGLGLTKAIGVSNFFCKKLADVLATATIPPTVNQVEVNPVWQQKKLIEFCKRNGILVVA